METQKKTPETPSEESKVKAKLRKMKGKGYVPPKPGQEGAAQGEQAQEQAQGEQDQGGAAPAAPARKEGEYVDPNPAEPDAVVHGIATEATTNLRNAGRQSLTWWTAIGRSVERNYAVAKRQVNKQTRKSIARQYTPLERAMVYAEELAGDAPLRSYIRKVMANLPEITAWLDRLPEWRRTKLNNPQYVYQQWLEATGRKKERAEPTYADYEKSAAHEVVDLVAEHAIGDNDKQKIASARKILRLASKSLTSEAFAG